MSDVVQVALIALIVPLLGMVGKAVAWVADRRKQGSVTKDATTELSELRRQLNELQAARIRELEATLASPSPPAPSLSTRSEGTP